MIANLAGPNEVLLIALVAAIGVFSVVVGISVLSVPRGVDLRLAQFVETAPRPPTGADAAGRPLASDLLDALNRRLVRRTQSADTRMLLIRANASITLAEFMLARIIAGVVGGALVALLLVGSAGLIGYALAVVAAFGASFLPIIYLRFRASRRLSVLEAQLPDALDLTASALQAGSGLAQAFQVIANDMPAPISEEFRRVNREVEMGLSMNEALANLVERMGSEDLDLVVTTINIQSRVGGNLVKILRVINHTIRERIRIRGEISVLTAMQRMSAIVIGAVPPGLAVIMYLMNPQYIGRLFVPGLGEAMLIIAVVMALIGFFVLRKITQIEV